LVLASRLRSWTRTTPRCRPLPARYQPSSAPWRRCPPGTNLISHLAQIADYESRITPANLCPNLCPRMKRIRPEMKRIRPERSVTRCSAKRRRSESNRRIEVLQSVRHSGSLGLTRMGSVGSVVPLGTTHTHLQALGPSRTPRFVPRRNMDAAAGPRSCPGRAAPRRDRHLFHCESPIAASTQCPTLGSW
jgi:hypothetical protein